MSNLYYDGLKHMRKFMVQHPIKHLSKTNKSHQISPTFFYFLILAFISNISWSYSPYTTRELDELEKEFVQQINQSDSILRNPLANQYINHLGQKLARHTQLPTPHFFIVKSNEINAFAGPGGHIGINTQLILASDSESELAAVMAHEMAHVRLHHLYRKIQHDKQMRIPLLASVLASAALGVVNPALGSGALMASLSGIAQDNINYTRAHEKEADRIGIDMLIKSGLDPRGMKAFFVKMQQNARYYYTDNIPPILRTHPVDEDRIAEAENRSSHILKKTYPDNLEYHLFKELIRTSLNRDRKKLLEFYQHRCNKKINPISCEYGYSLTLLALNKPVDAEKHLAPLLQTHPENFYFVTTMAQTEIINHQYNPAVTRLSQLQTNFPENYAVLVSYADALISADKPEKAVSILLKGRRKYKYDLTICHMLAQAQAANHRKDFAYFTQAQCELLQGRAKKAMSQLKLAKKLANRDHLLQSMINAKMDDINFLLDN